MSDTLLSARGLSLSFGAIAALDDVSCDLWPGEVLAIVGESGSGKTTLLDVLSGRRRADAGAVWYRDPAGKLAAILTGPFTAAALQSDFGRLVALRG